MSVYQTIIAGIDLGPASYFVAQRANEVARACGARLALVHVESRPASTRLGGSAAPDPTGVGGLPLGPPFPAPIIPPMPFRENPPGETARRATLEDEARSRMATLIQSLGLPPEHCHVALGNAAQELLRAAAELGADLIVVGTPERHGLAGLANRVEDKMLHHAPCDVLAVRVPDTSNVE